MIAAALGAHLNSLLSFVNWIGQVVLRGWRSAGEIMAATSGS